MINSKVLTIIAVCLVSAWFPVGASDVIEVKADVLMRRGLEAYGKHDYSAAITFFDARSKLPPPDPNALYYLGNCYLYNKQHDQAAKMYTACVRSGPASQAAKYSLDALEKMSSMPKAPDPKIAAEAEALEKSQNQATDKAKNLADKDSLMSEAALDKSFNDAVTRIKSQRQTLKIQIDRAYERMEEDIQNLQPRSQNYVGEMEKIRREAETKVEAMQVKELRLENRLMAQHKVDVRAIPKLPEEKPDDTKTALGSLAEYFTPEKPFDPLATDITPEMSAKFLSLKDVFGELSTYQPPIRRLAKQAFYQLKSGIENRQDQMDQRIEREKENLIRDICSIRAGYTNQQNYQQLSTQFQVNQAKIPRANKDNQSQMEQDIAQTTERYKRRFKEIQDQYGRDVDSLIAGVKERIGGMVGMVGQMNSQFKKPSGTIQIVPVGTDVYTRNYVNFGSRPELDKRQGANRSGVVQIQPLRAEAQKLAVPGGSKAAEKPRTK